MAEFRKKPVVIEALEFDGTVASADSIREWARKPDGMSAEAGRSTKGETCFHLRIETLEGTMSVSPGDWVILGVKGEFYPCKPDIFAATYEPADRRAPEPAGRGETCSTLLLKASRAARDADADLLEDDILRLMDKHWPHPDATPYSTAAGDSALSLLREVLAERDDARYYMGEDWLERAESFLRRLSRREG
jgi:hypothetical protein